MRPKLPDISVMVMIVLAIPLLLALKWLAVEFPNWDERSSMTWANDEYVMWLRSATNPYLNSSSIDKARVLLSIQSGRIIHLPLPQQHSTRDRQLSLVNDATQDGRVVWTTKHNSSLVHVTDVQSLKTNSFTFPALTAHQLLGGRYFMEFSNGQVKYIDLQESQPITHTADSFAPFYQACMIPDHPHFYCISPTPYGHQSQASESRATAIEPESAPPNSVTSFSKNVGQDTCYLILVRMTGRGPEEIAHWPINWMWGNPTANVMADGPYLFCRALDGCTLNVHDANTGEITTKIALTEEPNSEPPTRWQANRFSVRIAGATDAYDPVTGQKLPPALANKEILDRRGDHYLTLPYNPVPSTKRLDCMLQVCQYPTGALLATMAHPALDVYPADLPASESIRLSADGQQVVVCTQDERIFVLDALTGNIIRRFTTSPWRYLGILAVALATVAWMVAWWQVCTTCRVPRLIQLLVASALVLTYLLMRCSLNGHPYAPGRPAFQAVVALLIAWNTEVMQFFFRPFASVILRGTTLGCVSIATLILSSFYGDELSSESVLLFWLVITLTSGCAFLRQRICGRLPALNAIENPKSKFSIGELLLLTTVLACLTATLIQMDWEALLVDSSATTENLLIFAVVGLAAIVLRTWWWAQLACISLCTMVVATIAVTQYPDIPGHYTFPWLLCTLLLPLAFFSFFRVAEQVPSRFAPIRQSAAR